MSSFDDPKDIPGFIRDAHSRHGAPNVAAVSYVNQWGGQTYKAFPYPEGTTPLGFLQSIGLAGSEVVVLYDTAQGGFTPEGEALTRQGS
jgi:hypothetical protein